MPPKPPPPKRPGKAKVQVFRATYPYTAAHVDELSFEEGDLIYVSEQKDDGWWKAKINGKSGLVPGNYLQSESAQQVDNPMHEAAKRGNLGFLQECLDNKLSVNSLDKAGSTPLYWAARGGHLECVELLLKQENVDVNSQNKLGDSPLHGAAWKGHPEVITLILEAGANKNLRNNDGQTPYNLAKNPDAGRLLQDRRSSKLMDDYGGGESDSD